MTEKQVALKVFDEREMVDRDYEELCIGDDERSHYYFYREPEPLHPNELDASVEYPAS